MKFNREIFYDEFRKWRGVVLPQQVKGLNFLLDCIENDPHVARLDWTAYMLATTMHETAFTFMPVHEYGPHKYFVSRYGSQTKVGQRLGNDTPEEGYDYAGKGFPQTTGEDNYEKSEIALRREYPALIADFEKRTGKKFDLTVGDQPNDKADPQNMLDPQIAYAVMSYGMRSGMFTGLSLKKYFNQTVQDWEGARRIINGTDKAAAIAKYGQIFYAILKKAFIAPPDLLREEVKKIPAVDIPAKTEDAPQANESQASTEQTQIAETIVNNAAAPEPSETKEIFAPASEGSTAQSTKLTIAGFVVPTCLVGIFKSIQSAFENGYVDGKQVFDFVLKFITENTHYLFYLIGLIIVGLILRKLYKQITFFLQMWINADKSKHDIEIVKQ